MGRRFQFGGRLPFHPYKIAGLNLADCKLKHINRTLVRREHLEGNTHEIMQAEEKMRWLAVCWAG